MAGSSPPVFIEERTLKGHEDSTYGIAISHDGTLQASAGGDEVFLLTEILSGTLLYTFAHDNWLSGVVWSPDGLRLWVSGAIGVVFEVSRAADGGKWSHKTVYQHTTYVWHLTYVSALDLLALPCNDCLILVDVNTYNAIQTTPLDTESWAVVCNTSGSLLFVVCYDMLYAFARNGSGTYDKVGEVKAHKQRIRGLSLSASGSLLLVGSEDNTASLWRIASPFSSFGASPSMTFKGHTSIVWGAAFSGDEQFAFTCSDDKSICIWRVSDGTKVGRITCKNLVDAISFHAASGALAAVVQGNGVVIYRCAPHASTLPPPAAASAIASIDRRVRRPRAAAELSTIQGRIATFDASIRAATNKERSLLKEIAGLKDHLARVENDLASLRTADYLKKRDELAKLLEQEDTLLNEISVYDHVLRELEENTRMPNCLGHLHADGYEQWLHDIGLGQAVGALHESSGEQLKALVVRDIEEDLGLSFAESCSLLLRAYVTHYRLSPAPHFAPPAGLLSWDTNATSKWLNSLGAPYAALSSLGFTGPCLCSLNHLRVRTVMDIGAFNQLKRMVRDKLVSEGAPQWRRRGPASPQLSYEAFSRCIWFSFRPHIASLVFCPCASLVPESFL